MLWNHKAWASLLLLVLCTTVASCYTLVPLPDGVQPEGVTAGSNNDLWVACLSGAIVHVDLASNTSRIVHREPGVALSGAKFCPQQQALFAAGSLSGKGFIFHLRKESSSSGAGQQQPYVVTKKEVVQLAKPAVSYINDVALSADRAYFTDSFRAVIYSIPRFAAVPSPTASSSGSSDGSSSSGSGVLALARPVLRHPTGTQFATQLGQFRANGLAVYSSSATADTLLVANTHTGNMYSAVVPKAGTETSSITGGGSSSSRPGQLGAVAAAPGLLDNLLLHGQQGSAAEVTEFTLPTVKGGKTSDRLLLDGVWVSDSSMAFVADNYNNRVWGLGIEDGLASMKLSCLFQNSVLGVPTTLAYQQGMLWAVNAHLDTCFPFLPCPKHKFEVVGLSIEDCQPWP